MNRNLRMEERRRVILGRGGSGVKTGECKGANAVGESM